MRRMLYGVVILIVLVSVFFISYAVIVLPMEYTIDALIDSYPTGMEYESVFKNDVLTIPYYFVGAICVGIILLFVWFFSLAQKKEYEQD